MDTTYSLEKIASSYGTERRAEAEQRRLARAVRRARRQHTTPYSPDGATTAPLPVRVPRPRRWLGAFAPVGR
jgi:hypothetical protein